ncbi:hypothetical protein BBP40_012044 [Aspergillus hancockii]|nr:hypothetical protein BBP40_012044 [Aspergillus hancockii]
MITEKPDTTTLDGSTITEVTLEQPPIEWYLENHGLEWADEDHVRWVKTNPRHPPKLYCWNAGSEQARHKLGLGRSFSFFSFFSIYMLAQVIGVVFFPPYSESFGRKKLFIISTASYCIFSICMGLDVGTFVTTFLGWKWIFYLSAILLNKAVAGVRKDSGDTVHLQIRNLEHAPDFRTFAQVALIRPVRLFFTESIVFLCSVLSAVAAFGLLYLFTEALPVPRARRQTSRLCHQSPILAVGLWWFAWTIPPQVPGVHWTLSMLSPLLVGYATGEFDCTLAGYITASYTVFAASSFASIAFLRALYCAVFPSSTPRIYTAITPVSVLWAED